VEMSLSTFKLGELKSHVERNELKYHENEGFSRQYLCIYTIRVFTSL